MTTTATATTIDMPRPTASLPAAADANIDNNQIRGPIGSGSDINAGFAVIVAELTRRGLLAGGLATTALALGACADNDSSATTPSAPKTQTIPTAYGPVRAPAEPTRVVCVDTYTISALLDVGYTPIGVGDGGRVFMLARYGSTYDRLPKVASADDEINIEAVAALQPDLILGVNYPYIAKARSKLTSIAPTAVFTWDTSGDWRTMAAAATAAVSHASQENALQARYRERADQIKTTYADVLATTKVDLVTGGGGQAYVWLPGSGVAGVLKDAGVRLARASAGPGVHATHADQSSGFKALSYEQLDLLADATEIITLADIDGKIDPDSKALTQQATFHRLPAAQAGHVDAVVNFFPFSYGQALAALDELAHVLERFPG
ncbi:MAG: ABC transporter substrate-binding protein [Nocardioides sp.]